jgi:hypothetical protein
MRLQNWPVAQQELKVSGGLFGLMASAVGVKPMQDGYGLFLRAYVDERLGDKAAAAADYAAARQAAPQIDVEMRKVGIVPGDPDIKPQL